MYLIFLTDCLLINFPKTWCPGCGGGREAYTQPTTKFKDIEKLLEKLIKNADSSLPFAIILIQ